MIRVFVSSVQKEFAKERRALKRHIEGDALPAEPLYLTKYIERMGTGIRDMIADCQAARLPEPTFAQDGTLIRFGRGDDMHFGKGGDKDHDGKRGHHGRRGGHDDDHGWRGKHDGDRDGRRGPPPGDMPPPPAPDRQGAAPMPSVDGEMRQGAAAPLSVDPGEMRMALTEAGYSAIGEITQHGPRVLAMAINPEGEPVAVELDPQGEVLREINR